MQLSVSDLINFYRCQRLLFLNHFGDKKSQIPPTDFLKKLWKAGRNYEKTVVDFFQYEKPKYRIGDYDKGFEETLKLMKVGVESIYQGVLKIDGLQGIPDFLIKAEGNSVFGNYYYYPVDVKGASISRERYIFQLACYAYMLGETQGFTPFYGGLLLLDVDMQIKYFHDFMKEIVESVEAAQKILSNSDEMPDLFIDSGCKMCQWHDFCLPEAVKREHISLVPGVNKNIKGKLEAINIKSYSDLAECLEEDFASIEELGGEKGKTVILQSKCLKENKFYLKSLPEIKEEEKEIFIDFESDMIFDEKGTELIRVDYLIGLLKREKDKVGFISLILNDTEEQLEKDFSDFLSSHMDFTFYHYGHYEQSIFENKWTNLPKVKLINLEKIIRDSLIMPVTGYSLKNIVKPLGFKWKNKDANAMQSMCWYANYLETKDKKFLDLSVEYNKDDCYALLFLKDWLLTLKANELSPGEFMDIEKLSLQKGSFL